MKKKCDIMIIEREVMIMTPTDVLEKVKTFYESEYKDIKSILDRKPFWIETRADEKQVIFNAIQRCLGVAQFVQSLDVPYEELQIYDEYREKLEKLLDK